ncbi:MAG: heme lyase CcmF/NrfE family subunit [Alphaproteobacteria bacterium]|nr:MAG: heme lyase CcmF/NrfE family subunit [Alphaproteobacteria bacterium]
MIIELGHFAAILAFVANGLALFFGVQNFRHDLAARDASPIMFLRFSFLLLSAAMIALMNGYIHSDFTVRNIFENSHTMKPLLYKVSALWGNHEGSLLFWAWILAGYGCAFTFLSKSLEFQSRNIVTSVSAAVGFCFTGFMLLASNPFWRLFPPPPQGRDLNPILQDPALAFHPPLLYLGYIGSTVLFGFAMAALLQPAKAKPIFNAMRPWVLLVWSFLTLGIALGSYWAYYELGWGGWWFWDPVENASLMPWILCTALLHCTIAAARGQLIHWCLLLSIGAFGLSLIGTFLVRSGILTSVHAFANDPMRGIFLLGIIAIILGCALLIYALRAARISSAAPENFLSREMGFALHNLFAAVLCFTVFLGTLYPLFIELYNGKKLSIGMPYFQLTFLPIAAPLLLIMAVAPFLKTAATPSRFFARQCLITFAAAIILTAITIAGLRYKSSLGAVGIFIGCFAIAGSVWGFLRAAVNRNINFNTYTFALGHLGMGLSVIGMVASIAWLSEDTVRLKIGEQATVGDYVFTLQQITEDIRDNYAYVQARLLAEKNGYAQLLYPEKHLYPSQGMVTTESSRDTSLMGDVYTAMAEVESDKSAAIMRLSYHPLVVWIWLGAAIMGLAAFMQALRLLTIAQPLRTGVKTHFRFNSKRLVFGFAAAIILYTVIGSPFFLFIL